MSNDKLAEALRKELGELLDREWQKILRPVLLKRVGLYLDEVRAHAAETTQIARNDVIESDYERENNQNFAGQQPQAAEPVAFCIVGKGEAELVFARDVIHDKRGMRAIGRELGEGTHALYTRPQPAQDAKDAWPEEWRSFAEGYEVSSHGRTRSKGRLLQPYVKGKGYLAVSVWHGGKNKEMYVHRVVASAFCRRDDPSQDQVNHRDGDKLNNYASNLEWCTAKENRMHAARVLFSATRSVVGTNLKTGETITFRSLAEAEEHGFIRANIQKCIAGIRKKHGGFTWRDADTAVDAAMAKESGR